jgi:hypothetical protein
LKNWQAAFDYWMQTNLDTVETKMQRGFGWAEENFKEKVQADANLSLPKRRHISLKVQFSNSNSY